MGPHPCYRTGTRDATVPAPGYPRDSVGGVTRPVLLQQPS